MACSAITSAQQEDVRQTLPELVRRFAPQPVYQSRTHDFVLEALEQVLPRAELVVHGIVERVTTYLSADQKDLYTDYSIRPLRVIRQPATPALTRPGSAPAPRPIVVTRWGGQTTIEGVQVIQEDADVRAFEAGEEVVLLLACNNTDGKYILPSPASGAFSVGELGLKPLVKHGADDSVFDGVRGMTVAQFESEVHRLTR